MYPQSQTLQRRSDWLGTVQCQINPPMKPNTQHLFKVLSKATLRPLDVSTGRKICFHEGNRVSITRTHERKPGEEPTGETVAEVWITSNQTDQYDGALLTHGFNFIGEATTALRECLGELERLEYLHKPIYEGKLGMPDEDILKKTRELLRRLERVKMPKKL